MGFQYLIWKSKELGDMQKGDETLADIIQTVNTPLTISVFGALIK